MYALGKDAPVKVKSGTPASPSVLGRYSPLLGRELRASLDRGDPGLLLLLRYHMGWVDAEGAPSSGAGGKGLRPTLCLFACEAVGGVAAKAVPVALALELIHNFSLIHDDIQDGDRERHHRPTVWVQWGVPTALVAGNAMRVLADSALHGLLQRDVALPTALHAQSVLTERYLEMIEGQYLDLSFESRTDVTPDEYLTMVAKKTGALLEAATHLGALLGSREAQQVEAMRRCGRLLGLAFQARDDVLGVWGESGLTGKAVGADIRRKKKSLPVVHAFHQAGDAARTRLTELYQQDALDDDAVDAVLDVMEELGSQEFSQRVAEEKAQEAVEWVRRARLPAAAQAQLEEMASFFAHRQY